MLAASASSEPFEPSCTGCGVEGGRDRPTHSPQWPSNPGDKMQLIMAPISDASHGSEEVYLDEWEERAAHQASCDYGFHMAITGWSEQIFNDMSSVVGRGVNSFKHFMAYKGALMVNDDEMFASFSRCAALGALPFVHAENGDLVAALQAKLLSEGNLGPEAAALAKPGPKGRRDPGAQGPGRGPLAHQAARSARCSL